MTKDKCGHNRRQTSRRRGWFLIFFLGATLLAPAVSRSETVVLQLRNGDRLTGELISETTNEVVLATAWAAKLAVPVAQIARRTATNAGVITNAPAMVLVAATNPPPVPKRWKTEAQVGLDFAYGINRKQIYYGKFKLDYKRPYAGDPKRSFRNTFDSSAEYGQTDGIRSDNRMDGGVDTELDFSRRMFVYNLARAGYDEIRRIDAQYEVGPGLGYHLIQATNFAANLGLGVDYQERHQSDSTDNETVFSRLEEDSRWQINHRLSLDQKLEYFASTGQSRARFETNLKYLLLENLSLNLAVQDLYDTQPAANVDQNELRIRSSLGLVF